VSLEGLAMPDKSRKPNLFIIGAPKCGTTSLSSYLSDHPNLYFSNPKEPQYFNFDFANRIHKSLSSYMKLFEGVEDCHHVVAEGSTHYLFSQSAVPEIIKFNPDAKFIVMLRNPVDMTYSLHGEIYFNGAENIEDFETAWKLCEKRSRGFEVPKGCPDVKFLFYDQWGLLGEQVKRLLDTVSKSHVKFIVFDEFIAQTDQIYRDVLGFLKLKENQNIEFSVHNANKGFKNVKIENVRKVLSEIKSRSGIKKSFGILKKVKKYNTLQFERKPLSESFKAELKEYFRSDIILLSHLIEKNLDDWL
jgi:hypothetical protein